ncbi:MAG: thymidine phosphorylase [Lachnospiraceae bacterium]|nr:thymidine phosphorylase [Lachnospiraceae bacterium]
MRMIDLIIKKRNGRELSKEEIDFMVGGFTAGSIPDYQMSAMMMAILLKGMTDEETVNLTLAMTNSGEKVDLSKVSGITVDKHSTGGVGDKATLVLLPLTASCGLKVAKMSGRGLGHTGGTTDKFECFKGFNMALSAGEFAEAVELRGACLASAYGDVCPADRKMYALRDVTGTVESLPLIASSIVSKKLAGGADAFVFEVMSGSGAFMKNDDEATELARSMVKLGRMAGKKCSAVITNMDQPLGAAVGNSLEMIEALETLKGRGNAETNELIYALGEQMLLIGEIASTKEEAHKKLKEAIDSGAAIEKLKEIVSGQGGDIRGIDDYSYLPTASITEKIESDLSGYVASIKCDDIGNAVRILGGGRLVKEDEVDLSVGVVIHKKVGDRVEKGESLATIYANSKEKLEEAKEIFLSSYSFSDNKTEHQKLLHGIIE